MRKGANGVSSFLIRVIQVPTPSIPECSPPRALASQLFTRRHKCGNCERYILHSNLPTKSKHRNETRGPREGRGGELSTTHISILPCRRSRLVLLKRDQHSRIGNHVILPCKEKLGVLGSFQVIPLRLWKAKLTACMEIKNTTPCLKIAERALACQSSLK